MAQYMILPVEGQYNWAGGYTEMGWNFYHSINKKTKNAETIMKIFDYLSTPPIPLVYQRLPGSDPVYVAATAMHPFEPQPGERKGDVFFVGVFMYSSAKLPQMRETIILDDHELHARNFGEKEAPRYYLFGTGESIQKVRVCPRVDPLVRCWCVIQAVTKKPALEVIRDICERGNAYFPPDELPRQFYGRTPNCRSCKIHIAGLIDQVQVGQSAKCPYCGEQVVFLDLLLDLKSKSNDDDETPEMKLAKTKVYDLFIGHVCLPGLEVDWKDVIFRTHEPDEPRHDLEELTYQDTHEYLERMERLT
jgi:predicted RNA-binding Zn-ribbon protein involved in translation (DUF1610 family)